MIIASRRLHTGRLILAPSNPTIAVARGRLADLLRDLALLGRAMAIPADAFETGARFLELVAFTGCAVHLNVAPHASGNAFTHLSLHGPYERPRLLCGRNTRPPLCPDCGKSLAQWRSRTEHCRHGAKPLLSCTECGAAAPGWHWSWRQHAGFGRSLVFVEEVFPGEGSPLPPLLEALETLGAGTWQHFYVQD